MVVSPCCQTSPAFASHGVTALLCPIGTEGKSYVNIFLGRVSDRGVFLVVMHTFPASKYLCAHLK